ncbi:hypothetical protein GUJ93_ZPchr0009g219 [Zizania palustris]|uniref:Uncharacterized protein n=1 Tax=Zizania palustris TaxID=103762 RepID=A0A8J5S4S4_ZIZPA|nr:hypothetical protein GUJ93_ZPchr0009g219 [Zizania palustris]
MPSHELTYGPMTFNTSPHANHREHSSRPRITAVRAPCRYGEPLLLVGHALSGRRMRRASCLCHAAAPLVTLSFRLMPLSSTRLPGYDTNCWNS